jgi:hypothetical protein
VTAHSRVLVASAALLLIIRPARAQSTAQLTSADLVKAVIANELKPTDGPEVRWKYRRDKQADGRQETREVVETKSGSIERLISVSGKPLSEAQQRSEADRILRFSRDSQQQRKAEEARRKDAQQCNMFLQMIPQAFIFDYAGQSGNLIRITFKPNPRFQPPSREGKVLQQLAGVMWVDAKQQHLVSIDGRLINEVKFGGGLLGHLEKGGQFAVKRAELAPGDWQVTEMNVSMRGKALLFKSLSVQQKETLSDFERVPENLSIADAANLLVNQTLVASKRPSPPSSWSNALLK